MLVDEKVLVSTMSAPDSKYLLWMSYTMSGRVRDSRSLLPCRGFSWLASLLFLKSASSSWYCWIVVPMAPSRTTILFLRTSWSSQPISIKRILSRILRVICVLTWGWFLYIFHIRHNVTCTRCHFDFFLLLFNLYSQNISPNPRYLMLSPWLLPINWQMESSTCGLSRECCKKCAGLTVPKTQGFGICLSGDVAWPVSVLPSPIQCEADLLKYSLIHDLKLLSPQPAWSWYLDRFYVRNCEY